ncbi:hypothetical protein CALVIDRAFT_232857 [Calocera viscosa TUFC12733]|uniref:Uncharacterized protein n=1 Tax=Calocera viscosa (strain TUFC12733) TaxID=1330018 RepID=A0A167JY70_CALVF|nr:hypothetical protein CALVIDRAFT_232857 [Calocera viscosa TUFC12733]
MPEPAVFIVVAILAAACAAAPFVYWHIKSRRSPSSDPTDRIGPIMRRLEQGGPLAPLPPNPEGFKPPPQLPGAAGLVALPRKPGTGAGAGAGASAPSLAVQAGADTGCAGSPPSRASASGSGSSRMSGTTYVPSGPSSARGSTSTRSPAASASHYPQPAAGYQHPASAYTHPEGGESLPVGARTHAQRQETSGEAPPAYEEVVDSLGAPEGDAVGEMRGR